MLKSDKTGIHAWKNVEFGNLIPGKFFFWRENVSFRWIFWSFLSNKSKIRKIIPIFDEICVHVPGTFSIVSSFAGIDPICQLIELLIRSCFDYYLFRFDCRCLISFFLQSLCFTHLFLIWKFHVPDSTFTFGLSFDPRSICFLITLCIQQQKIIMSLLQFGISPAATRNNLVL